MADKKFSVGEAISFGYDTVSEEFMLFFWLGFAIFIFLYLVAIITGGIAVKYSFFMDNPTNLMILGAAVYGILLVVFKIGAANIFLMLANHEGVGVIDFFEKIPLFFKAAAGLSILYVMTGLIPTVADYLMGEYFPDTAEYESLSYLVMAILVAVENLILLKYQFYIFFIVGEGESPLMAIKRSGEISDGQIWSLFIFEIIFFLLAFAMVYVFVFLHIGFIARLFKIFFALAYSVSLAYIFRKLNEAEEERLVALSKMITPLRQRR